MYDLASGIIGGTIAVFALGLFAPELRSDSLAALRTPSDVPVTNDTYRSVNRSFKSDRLTPCTPTQASIGADACPFQLGQAAQKALPINVTIVSKTAVPNKSSRDTASTPFRVPAKPRDLLPVINLPVGCESAVSVAADPELARTPSRCIS